MDMILALIIVLQVALGVALALILVRIRGVDRFSGGMAALKENQERIERVVKDEIARNREETQASARQAREETNAVLKNQLDTFSRQLLDLTQMNEKKLENIRETVEKRLVFLQEDNTKTLEKMRETVDEKLHATLERRLGESFRLVSERLELVHKGLGEMQSLATGVGDLKKVLTNIKVRGTWGEIQLGNILEEMLTPEQFLKNVATKKGSKMTVEYAVKLPGNDDHTVLLPIDAKFPREDYERLLDAQEKADRDAVEEYAKALENRIKAEAKDIRDKYLDPPNTTDFGILFLPIEGLYAEVLRRPGLQDNIRRDYRVAIAGPTTISAFLNSLQMGFRSLAIEKRASDVWQILGSIKTEFGKFGDILEKTHKKIQEAGNTIENAARKSRNIERKLKRVQSMPDKSEAPLMIDSVEVKLKDEEDE